MADILAESSQFLTEKEVDVITNGEGYVAEHLLAVQTYLARVRAKGGAAIFAGRIGLSPTAGTEFVDKMEMRFQGLSKEGAEELLGQLNDLVAKIPELPEPQTAEKLTAPVLPVIEIGTAITTIDSPETVAVDTQPELDIPTEAKASVVEAPSVKDDIETQDEPAQAEVVSEVPEVLEVPEVVSIPATSRNSKAKPVARQKPVTRNKQVTGNEKALSKSTQDYLVSVVGEFDQEMVSTDDAERLAEFLVSLRGTMNTDIKNAFPYKQALTYRFQGMGLDETGALLQRNGANVGVLLSNFKKAISQKNSPETIARLFHETFGDRVELAVQDDDVVAQELEPAIEIVKDVAPETAETQVETAPIDEPVVPVPTPSKIETGFSLERVEAVAGHLAESIGGLNKFERSLLQRDIDPSQKHGLVKVDTDTLAVIEKFRTFLFRTNKLSLKDEKRPFTDLERTLLMKVLGAYEGSTGVSFVTPETARTIVHTGEQRNINEDLAEALMNGLQKIGDIIAEFEKTS